MPANIAKPRGTSTRSRLMMSGRTPVGTLLMVFSCFRFACATRIIERQSHCLFERQRVPFGPGSGKGGGFEVGAQEGKIALRILHIEKPQLYLIRFKQGVRRSVQLYGLGGTMDGSK